MRNLIIGRENEMKLLEQFANSSRAEFIAIYGRRRVGKTFLVRHFFENHFAFDMTGIIEGTKTEQMAAFNDALKQYGYKGSKVSTWLDAFFALRDLLQAKQDDKPQIIFIDEMPCLDTPKSGFVKALGHFWNSWGAWQPSLKLIVCGSATSWMVRNVIDNHGGLHDRVTHEIALRPFTLHEAETFFKVSGFPWSRLGILHAYMAVGGVPYYLSLFLPGESPAQGIDRLFFAENGELRREFKRLFSSLFRIPEPYLNIIRALVKKPEGMTREQLSKQLNISNNGKLGSMLTDLVYCDFLKAFRVKSRKLKRNSAIYKLVDFYTLFYLSFADNVYNNSNYWTQKQETPTVNSWMGITYERVCMAHVAQVKKALGISGMASETYSWHGNDNDAQAQIDMLIERSDKMINLCEIKYSESVYSLTQDEFLKIGRRVDIFRKATHTNYGIVPTMITTFGLAQGMYAESISATVTMDDLFVE